MTTRMPMLDWRLLDRHATRQGATLADLVRRELEPLLQRLRANGETGPA